MKHSTALISSLALTLLILCCVAAGQGLFGTISGTISDSTGAVVPNATVKVTNINTGVVRTYVTNAAGLYSATSLNPGVYEVRAETRGFKAAIARGIRRVSVPAGQRPTAAPQGTELLRS